MYALFSKIANKTRKKSFTDAKKALKPQNDKLELIVDDRLSFSKPLGKYRVGEKHFTSGTYTNLCDTKLCDFCYFYYFFTLTTSSCCYRMTARAPTQALRFSTSAA